MMGVNLSNYKLLTLQSNSEQMKNTLIIGYCYLLIPSIVSYFICIYIMTGEHFRNHMDAFCLNYGSEPSIELFML